MSVEKNSNAFHKPGTLIDQRYEIEQVLSRGDGRAVYLCHLIANKDKKVAMKVLHKPRFGEDFSTTAKRFRTELVAAYNITHENVVHVFEFIEHPNFLAYVMEYVSGGNLENLINDERIFDAETARKFLSQICAGLHAIHEQGIIHRELKPRNILITKDGDVKITDFGVARVKKHKNLTMHGGIVGTMDYLSPEYVTQGKFDKTLDIYSVGVIGYELLVGEVPFANRDMMKMLTQRIGEDPTSPSEIHPECPKEFSNIILKALSRKIEDRFTSALEMHVALDSLGILEVSPMPVSQASSDIQQEGQEAVEQDDFWSDKPIQAPAIQAPAIQASAMQEAPAIQATAIQATHVQAPLDAKIPSKQATVIQAPVTDPTVTDAPVKSYFELDAIEELNTGSQVEQPLDDVEVLTAIHSDTLSTIEDRDLRDELLKSFEDDEEEGELETSEFSSGISPSVSQLHRAIEARSTARVGSPKLLFVSAFCVALGLGSLTYAGPQGQPEVAQALSSEQEVIVEEEIGNEIPDIKKAIDKQTKNKTVKNKPANSKSVKGKSSGNESVVKLSSEDEEGAIKEYKMLLSLNPADPKVNYNLGLLYVGRGEYKTAQKYLEEAVRLDSSNTTAAYYLRKVRRKLES